MYADMELSQNCFLGDMYNYYSNYDNIIVTKSNFSQL